ncbi:hypothetical protein FACS1894105_10650 [Clostridia bacterium]|nr:hypothetical protein FACS1894105_10650 [Clostridia bacterium]
MKPTTPIIPKPYAHQKAAFDGAMNAFDSGENHGYAYFMDMGTGKSFADIMTIRRLYLEGKISSVIIISPLTVVGVWMTEFAKFADFMYNISVVTGKTAHKDDALKPPCGEALRVVVTNYETAWRMEKQIDVWRPDMIICDESHKIKNHAAIVSKSLHRLGCKAKYRLILTGTPVTNHASDIFSQYKFIEPSVFGKNYYAFRSRYFTMCGYGNYTALLKPSAEPELTAKIQSVSYRATKAQCLDLPAVTDIIRSVELEPSAAKIYRDLARNSYAELIKGKITAANILTKLLRLSQVTGGYVGADGEPIKQISKAKIDALSDIIESVTASGQKIVVIARFTAEIAGITALCEKLKIGYTGISGATKNRAEIVDDYQNNPNTQIFIGQIAAAGLGITLTAASTMVFYSIDYSSSNHEQARARIHRAGQTQPCCYYYLAAKNTIDEKVIASLREKTQLAKKLIGDCRDGVNPFDQI